MEHYRRTDDTHFDIKFHLVWITKYRKKLLRGDVGPRFARSFGRTVQSWRSTSSRGMKAASTSNLFVSCPPHVSVSYLMQPIKGRSSRRLMQEYNNLKRLC
ncbi:IS200/IS605 family transposase [Singulisphaera sp. GP187]|uniref:IS200/IS605 family transposase n=1 Tax=Singulisphaera sp. GP187 TaxID=1882752 RepID=UPI0009F8DD9E